MNDSTFRGQLFKIKTKKASRHVMVLEREMSNKAAKAQKRRP